MSRFVHNLLQCNFIRCRLPLNKFIPAYHHHFGHQCRVSDYGFAKLQDLLQSIGDVITLTRSAISNDLSESVDPCQTNVVFPSNPILDSAPRECNKRVFQSDPSPDRVSQSNASEDQSERFLQLNWKEMVGVLANQVTAMLKTITNQTLPLKSFLQT